MSGRLGGAFGRRLAATCLGFALAAAVGLSGVRILRQEIVASETVLAADALPVWLSTVALASGRDPTDREVLEQVYLERGLSSRAATFSTLYPATLAGLLRPFAALSWDSFVHGWRVLLLVSIGATGGVVAFGQRLRPGLGWIACLGTVLALLLLPATAGSVRLGQVNGFVGLLMAGALVALHRDRGGVAAVLAAVGAAVKLVPAGLLLPLVAARRWTALAAGVATWLLVLAWTARFLDPLRVLEGIVATVRFQDFVAPDWIGAHASSSSWVLWLGVVRHRPLLLVTGAVVVLAAALRPRPDVLAGGAALCATWVGTSASAFHVLYTPLLYPVLAWLLTWPFVEGAPRGRAFGVAVLAGLSAFALPTLGPTALVPEARWVLVGCVLWTLACVRLAWAFRVAGPGALEGRWPGARPRALLVLGLWTGGVLAWHTPDRALRGPPLPEGGPRGAGFLADAPGGAAGLVEDGSIAPYLVGARARWAGVAERYPAWSWEAAWVADAAPVPAVRTPAEVVAFLAREGMVLGWMGQDGLDVRSLREGWAAAVGLSVADSTAPSAVPSSTGHPGAAVAPGSPRPGSPP